MIELSDISKTYQMGDEIVRALDHVSLTVADHEFVAIVGQSGSGKSTLMNIVGCLDTPDGGTYLLDGKDVSDLSDRQLGKIRARQIGFVFQQFNLLQKLTALENVELPLVYQGVGSARRRERAMDALMKVGLEGRVHHRPTELSGGQQQRVAIARALVADPSIILADEPTGNLDSRSGKEIMDFLDSLHEQGRTILLITHDGNVAARAGRRIHIADGRIGEEEAVAV